MGKQRSPQGSRRGPPARPNPSAPAVIVDAAASQDPAEVQAEAIEAAVTEATPPETVADALTESVSPAALEAAAAAEIEPGPTPQAEADEPAAEALPEAGEAVETEPEPAASEPVEAPAEQAAAPETVAAPVQEAAEAVSEAVSETFAEPEAAVAAVSEAAKAGPRLAGRFTFAPAYLDVEGIGTILFNYVQTESAAALSHMRALGEVRTPADMIRLNVTEMQRAADASLTCWMALARRASRPVAAH